MADFLSSLRCLSVCKVTRVETAAPPLPLTHLRHLDVEQLPRGELPSFVEKVFPDLSLSAAGPVNAGKCAAIRSQLRRAHLSVVEPLKLGSLAGTVMLTCLESKSDRRAV